MGTVYAATDLTQHAPVALKTLHQLGPEGLLRLKHEFRALADLAHPNLVQLYELLGSDDGWFFTMEAVNGPTFLEWLSGRAGPAERVDSSTFDGWDAPPDPDAAAARSEFPSADRPALPTVNAERVRDGFRQLCRGIAALHAADRLHRDLKPSNVRVTTAGRVVVLDFGLVVAASTTGPGAIAGSAAYMAPEQAAGEAIGPAADLYAVGVMLYEALCGERPFVGTVAQLLQAKQRYDAPDPRRPGVPEDLSSLCRALLARDPAARPTLPDVLRRLGDTGTAVINLPFGGREAELEALHAAWAEARSGAPVLVEVVGRSGIGKSTLVRAFLDALGPGVVVLAGRCYERESVPYKALDTVVDALAEHLVRGGFEPADPDLAVLAELFPVLRRVRAIDRLEPRSIPDAQERRTVGFAALERLVRGLAPLVLSLDDVHWGDADSGVWMARLLASRAPVLVVWTRRAEHAPGPFVEHSIATSVLRRRTLALDVLPDEVTRGLAARLRPDAPESSLDAITRESGGNPLYLLEIAAAHAPGDTPPPSLDDAIRARAATLPDDARRLLEALAVAGRPWPVARVAGAIGLDDPRAAVALLRAGRFARTAVDAIECLHDRVREAVATKLPPDRSAAIHRHLADALLRQDAADPEQVAQHLAGAGDPTQAAAWTVRAAELAAAKLAFDHAAALYRRALDLDPPRGAALRDLSARLGHAHAGAGRALAATEAWLVAADGAPQPERLELLRASAEHLFASGHRDRGHEVLATALREVGLRVPSSTFGRVADLGWQLTVTGVRGVEPPARLGPLPERDRQQIDLCFSAMLGLVGTDRLASAQLQARHLNLAVRTGDPLRMSRALAGEAVQAAFRGSDHHRARAHELLDRARDLAPEDPALWGFLAYCSAVVAFFCDQMAEADTWFDRAESHHLRQPGAATWDLLRVRLMRVWPHLHAGRLRAMSELVQALVHEAAERDNPYAAVTAVAETGFVRWLVLDDPRGALDRIDAHAERWQQRFDVQWYALANARAQIALYRGDAASAVHELTENQRRLKWSMLWGIRLVRSGFRVMAARLLWGAALSARGSEREALLDGALAHADAIAKLGLPSGPGHVAMIRGRVAVARGRVEVAVPELERARAELEPRGFVLAGSVCRRLAASAQGDLAGVAACDAVLTAEGVVDPERFCVAVV